MSSHTATEQAQATPPAVITHTLIRLQGTSSGDITVYHAQTSDARMVVTWAGVMLTFWSAQAAQSALECLSAARPLLAPLQRNIPAPPQPTLEPFVQQTISLNWTRRATYAVVPREELARDRSRTIRWIDIHCGPCTWQILDRAGFDSAVALLRRAHLTARAIFTDGPKFAADPTRDDFEPLQ